MDWWSCRLTHMSTRKQANRRWGPLQRGWGGTTPAGAPQGPLGAAAEADDALADEEDVVADEAPEGDRVDGPVQLRERIQHHALREWDGVG